ncbi:MAG: hypothetical protein M0R32_11280 [Candidatus Cloacimonetes bacterium]|jgi:hypothetical protein|nr:hypothetical protein [Candidatus Cloacimonadota bacterium]
MSGKMLKKRFTKNQKRMLRYYRLKGLVRQINDQIQYNEREDFPKASLVKLLPPLETEMADLLKKIK